MNYRNIKLDLDKSTPMDFIKKNVRENYTDEIFEWQYVHENSNLFVIERDNEIVGTQGMIFSELIYQGDKVHSSKSETTYLSDVCRGTGAFETIYQLSTNEAFTSGSSFIWGFTALGQLWKKKLGFEYEDIISESVLFLRANKQDNFKRNLIKKMLRVTLATLLLFGKKYKIEISDKLSDFVFLDDFYSKDDIYLDYESSSFVNRTSNNPFIHYQVMKFFEKEQQIASIIFQKSFGSLVICDIQYEKTINIDTLLKTIVSFAMKQNDVSELKFWGNKYNVKYQLVFNAMRNVFAKEYEIKSMQLVYKTKLNKFELKNLFINSLWTEGFKY